MKTITLLALFSFSIFSNEVKTISACGWLNIEKIGPSNKNEFVLHNFDLSQRFILKKEDLRRKQRKTFSNLISVSNKLEVYPNACIQGEFLFKNKKNILSRKRIKTLKAQPVDFDKIEYDFQEITSN